MGDGGAETLVIRPARREDVAALAALFAADSLGGHGDSAEPAAMPDYLAAFDRIAASANDRLYVAELHGAVVGTFQTTTITSLSARGSTNMTVEAVQTRGDMRGRGIGEAMMRFAIERAREAGARQVQLMSNNSRVGAHRFYERLGFARSHVGFKL
ncbi:MAG: GNAT family N-acetyltransferase [Rhizobiaceae bacterium]|uniref:GNAT family N-acetyltransferase n=1 Tax=Albidovulum sp. TaxID=1872424 RepID=UPI0013AA6270|nr:MAG: GNAT family N-acetyltransferase [Rhizobiaceae bacterium]CAG1012623.1 aminoalkylphosphonate N-acetyltransferase [Rhizobiaceae bacterium]